MLAELAPAPFDSEKHLFEPKWDGVRCLAYLSQESVRLEGRSGNDLTPLFPELDRGIFNAPASVLDGEVICGNGSTSSFQLIQSRVHKGDSFAIKLASRSNPATLMVFDILELNERPVLSLALWERKMLLDSTLKDSQRVKQSPFFEAEGRTVFQSLQKDGYEGVMAKHRSSPYLPGKRSPHWLKVKVSKVGEFLAVGLTQGAGNRAHSFGALVLAAREGDKLIYKGEVGSGLSDTDLRQVLSLVNDAPAPAFLPMSKRVRWIEPIRCRVKFLDESEDGKLRFPVFMGLAP
jgi:ATP-dependent DNA ligase